jgi:hypothetical protein
MASRRLAAAIVVGMACWVGVARAETASSPLFTAAELQQVKVEYDRPSDPAFQPIYEALTRRKVLERIQGFLAALRLPKPLTIRVAECGGADTIPYEVGGPATICYELVRKIQEITYRSTNVPSERVQVLYGTFVEAMLHQTAYAIFESLQAPVWGREDDAADRLAAFIMTQFGDQVAVSTILGTAKFFDYSQHAWTGGNFADTVSPEAQRFYNYLCIAYGADPITFHFLAGAPSPGLSVSQIPDSRAVTCAREFEQVRHAFNLRIMPFVDPDLMTKVRATQWLKPDETPGLLQ